jgi:biopolymer transport protein ExbD
LFFALLSMNTITLGPPHRGYPGNSIDLPSADHHALLRRANAEDAMKLGVARNAMVYFGFQEIEKREIPSQIHEALAAGSEKHIDLWADRRAKWGDVREALAEERQAEVSQISILTEPGPPVLYLSPIRRACPSASNLNSPQASPGPHLSPAPSVFPFSPLPFASARPRPFSLRLRQLLIQLPI